jgi:hypothetical protein
MTKLIPEENAAAATATTKKPKRNQRAHVAPRRAHIPPAQAKSARKATPAKKAQRAKLRPRWPSLRLPTTARPPRSSTC